MSTASLLNSFHSDTVQKNKPAMFAFAIAVIGMTMTGCVPRQTVEPLGKNYDEVTYTYTSAFNEQDASTITLQYRKPNGWHVVIWPSVFGDIEIDGTAIFIGDLDNHRRRFFAVGGEGPILDITDEVLRRWSKANEISFAEAAKTGGAQTISKKDDQVVFDFGFIINDWPHIFTLSPKEVSEIMAEVKEKGADHKAQGRHYLAIEPSYDEDTYWYTPDFDKEANQLTLQYEKPNGWHATIWPSVVGYIEVDGTAIFIGELDDHSQRFFSVKGQGPILDITGEVLRRWSRETGIGFAEASKTAGAGTIHRQGDQVEFRLTFGPTDWPRMVTLNFKAVSEIMDEVKEKGVDHRAQGMHYLAEE